MGRLLKVPDAASELNVSEKTIWKLVYGHKVAVVRIGRSVRIKEESIRKLIDDNTIPADGDDDEDN